MGSLKFSRSMLFIVTIAFWFSLYAYTPYVNPQLITMGVTASFMGFVGGAYGFIQVLLRVPVGVYTDRWRKKIFISAGCLCVALSPLCMLLFHTPIGFLLGRTLGGAAASSWVSVTVLYTSYYEPEQATRSIATINLATQLGRMFSFLMAGTFAAKFGPPSAFVLSVIGGFLALGSSFFVHEDKSPSGKKHLTIRELAAVGSERNLLIVSALAIGLQMMGFATYFTFTANHAVAIGTSTALLGYLPVALFLPAIILGYLLSRYILLKIDAKPLVVLGFSLLALYCLLVPFTTQVWQLFLVQVLGGSGNTLTFSLLMGLSVLKVPTEKRGAAMGVYQAIYSTGMMLGPLFMGLLTDAFSLRIGFFFMAGVGILATVFSKLLLQKTKQQSA